MYDPTTYNPLRDTLGRRRRRSPRQPKGKQIQIFEQDLDILQWIHERGMQPKDNIFEYAKRRGFYTTKNALNHRLEPLYNELGIYMYPKGQNRLLLNRYYSDVIAASSAVAKDADGNTLPGIAGTKLLQKHDRYTKYGLRPVGWFEHQKMTCSLYSSYEFSCEDHGLIFTPQHVICERVGHGSSIMLGTRKLRPDAVFHVAFPTLKKEMLIFLEADRDSEGADVEDPDTESIKSKYEKYAELIPTGKYKEYYGVPEYCGAQVHFVTTTKQMENRTLKNLLEKWTDGKGCSWFLTHTTPAFGEVYYPYTVLPMVPVTWHRAGYKDVNWLEALGDKPVA